MSRLAAVALCRDIAADGSGSCASSQKPIVNHMPSERTIKFYKNAREDGRDRGKIAGKLTRVARNGFGGLCSGRA
ncbi:MAG TPA: hypothetical protein VJM79_06990, partial [Rhizorhapis sp.]|nr:hypothetical protein [Rhizorhapis sp.]